MKPPPTHQIIHTYINRHGVLASRVNSKIVGGNDDFARQSFDQHVRVATDAWRTGRTWNGVPVRITGIVMIDAADTVLAEWAYEPEVQEAA